MKIKTNLTWFKDQCQFSYENSLNRLQSYFRSYVDLYDLLLILCCYVQKCMLLVN